MIERKLKKMGGGEGEMEKEREGLWSGEPSRKFLSAYVSGSLSLVSHHVD